MPTMETHPFRALRYSRQVIERRGLDNLVAPPYDRITPEIRTRLYGASPENIVRFDSRREEPGEDVYAGAAGQLREWLGSGVMDHERSAAMWIEQVTFPGRDGSLKIRRALIALVLVEEYEGGSIRPHERTLAKAKEDRLNLLKASHADFGMVFLLTRAPLEGALQTRRAPDLTCRDLAGHRHDAWRIEDPAEHVKYQRLLSTAGALIADGHHRYETALKFSKMAEAEKLPTARLKLCAIVDVASPGLEAFAIPRLVSGLPNFSTGASLKRAGVYFDAAAFSSTGEARQALAALPPARTGFLVVTKGEAPTLLTMKERPGAISWPEGKSEAWRRLDVASLEAAFFWSVMNIAPEQIARGEFVSFPKDEESAIAAVEQGSGQMAILLRPTPIAAVQEVVAAGDVLPQKSTLFEPKFISGMFGVSLEDGVY